MNPSPDLNMEYYSDYDFQGNNGEENYDHYSEVFVDKFILELKTKLGDYDHNGDIDFLIVLPVFL